MPTPQELAAYRDGELTGPDRQRVEEWLAAHPEAAAEVNALHRLDVLYQSAAPAEPADSDWDRVLCGIERGLAANPDGRTRRLRRRAWVASFGGAAAAVIVLTVTLGRWHTPAGGERAGLEPFPVASNDDVEIVSIDAASTAAIVVGELPLRNPIVLMEPGDVALRSVSRDRQGAFPDLRLEPDAEAAPMIVGPVAAGLEPTPLP